MRFRERALRHRRSNDDLDAVMRVTNVRGWLWAAALTVAVAVVVVFGFAGKLPQTVTAPGILLSPDGVVQVPAGQTGEIVRVLPVEGSRVSRGEVIAELAGGQLVTSRYAGEVVAVRTAPGRVVGPASPILTVERGEAGTLPDALVFLPSEAGNTVRAGMSVDVAVASAPREEYGVVRGEVRFVSKTVASADEISALLANETLGGQFTASGAPLIARVRLERDASTPSGLEWSTGDGPPFRLTAGSLITADVIEADERPVDAVFGG